MNKDLLDKPIRIYPTEEQKRLIKSGDITPTKDGILYSLPFIYKEDNDGNWFIVKIDR